MELSEITCHKDRKWLCANFKLIKKKNSLRAFLCVYSMTWIWFLQTSDDGEKNCQYKKTWGTDLTWAMWRFSHTNRIFSKKESSDASFIEAAAKSFWHLSWISHLALGSMTQNQSEHLCQSAASSLSWHLPPRLTFSQWRMRRKGNWNRRGENY